jgi:exodeoxyribonuclease VII large subunit
MRHLRALSPERTLERGYAVVSGPDGRVLRRADEVSPGMTVRARLAHGSIEATVTEVVDLASAPVGDRSEEVES